MEIILVKMRKVYLDMNIIRDFMDESRSDHLKIKGKIELLKDKSIFLYSPAHIEEIARIFRSGNENEKAMIHMYEQMKVISELTDNNEVLPSYTNIKIKQEHSQECLKRVLEDYESTLFVEKLNEPNIKKKEANISVQNDWGIDKKELGNINPLDLFSHEKLN